MPRDQPWTADRVEAELRGALVTLRRIPGKHLLPAGFRVAWPDVLADWESYGWDRASRPRTQATAEQIRDMDVALGWLWNWLHPGACASAGLAADTSTVLLMRAAGLTWEKIGEWRLARWCAPKAARGVIPGGNSIKSLRAIHRAGIGVVVERLGGGAQAPEQARAPREHWDVSVEVAQRGETLGEGSYGPVHARAKWGMVRRGRG